MAILLVIFAVLAAGAGVLFLSNATTGVGILCGACLLGILARIAQASAQHDALLEVRDELRKSRETLPK